MSDLPLARRAIDLGADLGLNRENFAALQRTGGVAVTRPAHAEAKCLEI